MFQCRIAEEYEPLVGVNPDNDQIGVVSVSMDELNGSRVYPSSLRHALAAGAWIFR